MLKYVMTAFFLLAPAWVQAAPTASDCDFDNSGKVDFADFIAFSQAYGTDQAQFDLDGDAAVNFRDFIIFAQFYGQETTALPIGIQTGMRAPDFTLRSLAGERFNLYEKRGKPVFLNFWATWCGPCIAEMPDIERLQQTMGDHIQIVGIDMRESVSTVRGFVQRGGFTWTFVLDSTGEVSSDYEVSGIPTSLFLDAKGVIVRRFVGSRSYETFLDAAQQAINN